MFGADHIYRMDVGQMLAYHAEKNADVTVAALPESVEKARAFGVIETNKAGRVVGFEEKPKNPKPLPGDPSRAYCSMGNYIFNRDVLEAVLTEDFKRESAHDFGKNIFPALYEGYRVFAYDFRSAVLPGQRPYEEKGYWRDVGNLESYWSAHMDLLGKEPLLDLSNPEWPIYAGRYDGPSARVFGGEVSDVILSEGAEIHDAVVRHSVLGRGVIIHPGAVVEDSVLMDFCEVGAGSRFKRVVADRFNVFPENTELGYDPKKDEARHHLDKSGLVVVRRGRSKWAHLKR